jgi:hypothetical protein
MLFDDSKMPGGNNIGEPVGVTAWRCGNWLRDGDTEMVQIVAFFQGNNDSFQVHD